MIMIIIFGRRTNLELYFILVAVCDHVVFFLKGTGDVEGDLTLLHGALDAGSFLHATDTAHQRPTTCLKQQSKTQCHESPVNAKRVLLIIY